MDFEKPPSIIVSLDLPLQKASKLVRELEKVEGKIAAYKISSLQAMESGLKQAVAELRLATQIPLIYDHQKGGTDIPEMVEQQVKLAADAGINSFIGVPQGAGRKSLESFVNACKKNNMLPIILIEMSHPESDSYLHSDYSWRIFQDAAKLGVRHIVAPGNKPERLKLIRGWIKDSGKQIFITSPGIGAQGGSAKDAVAAGTDYPIIGRQIYQSENPANEVEKIYKECIEGFRERKSSRSL